MNLVNAQIVAELLTNAGYLDDADEILGDRLDDDGEEETLGFADRLDQLITDVNSVLPKDERISMRRTMREEVERHLENR